MDNHINYYEESGVHIFEWKSANRRAVDIWLKWMSRIVQRDGSPGRILIDFSEIGLPPVRYLAAEARQWLTYHAPSDDGGATVAVVYPVANMPFLIVARSYSVTLARGRPVKLEFFSSDEIELAFNWLLSHAGDTASSG